MKRSAALSSLSRDHHQALVIAQRLRRAEDGSEAAPEFLEFWRREGEHHFRVEEEVLLPLWEFLGSVDETAAARLSREHLSIRADAVAIASGAPSLERLQNLGEDLAAHVRFEERELFPAIEADLAEQDLERLAQAVTEAEAER